MMENELNIALIQEELEWENPAANRARFTELFKTLKNVDVAVLPEMFTTGFSMTCAHLAEEMDGPTVRWMKEQSALLGGAICGSVLIETDSGLFNRLLWVTPDGKVEYYDKRHLFTLANEQDYFQSGDERLIVDYKGWKICPMICYDLRFPVWSRNGWDAVAGADYDLLIYVANWPSKRADAWRKLLVARAIENQSYVVGVNRIGHDGKGFEYTGDSRLFDAMGKELIEFEQGDKNQKTHTLVKSDLVRVREKLSFLPDQDRFTIL